jgi:hypothetical protein
MKYGLFLLGLICFVGCDTGASTNYSSGTSTYTSDSEVMSESHRSDVVDHMVGQGADRAEAEAFTKALNDAQRDWENNR